MPDDNKDTKVAGLAEGVSPDAQAGQQGGTGDQEEMVPKAQFDALQKELRRERKQAQKFQKQLGSIHQVQQTLEEQRAQAELKDIERELSEGRIAQSEAEARKQQIQTRQVQTVRQQFHDMLSTDETSLSDKRLQQVKEAADRGDYAVAMGIYAGLRDTIVTDADDGDATAGAQGHQQPKVLTAEDIERLIEQKSSEKAELKVKAVLQDLKLIPGKEAGIIPGGGVDYYNMSPEQLRQEAYRQK